MRAQRFTHDGRTGTLREWAEWTGVPKNTIDRRLRKEKSFGEAISPERAAPKPYEYKEPRGLPAEKVREIRQDHKDGIRGKASHVKHGLTKAQYTDIVANRIYVETEVWWKGDA